VVAVIIVVSASASTSVLVVGKMAEVEKEAEGSEGG
jgi:hypothetical protein